MSSCDDFLYELAVTERLLLHEYIFGFVFYDCVMPECFLNTQNLLGKNMFYGKRQAVVKENF